MTIKHIFTRDGFSFAITSDGVLLNWGKPAFTKTRDAVAWSFIKTIVSIILLILFSCSEKKEKPFAVVEGFAVDPDVLYGESAPEFPYKANDILLTDTVVYMGRPCTRFHMNNGTIFYVSNKY